MNEKSYREFKLQFPVVAEKVIKVIECTDYLVIAKLNDDTYVEYDVMNETLRNLYNDPDNMSDERWCYEFGRKLKAMMWRKGLRQEDLAKLSGLSQGMISGYIRGTSKPSVPSLYKIAKALKCSANEFIYIGGRIDNE